MGTKRWTISGVLLLATLLASPAIAADESSAHVNSLTPELHITGDSTGTAKLTLGASWTTPSGPDGDLTGTLALTTSTKNGFAQLLQLSSGGSKSADWGVLLEGAYARLLPIPDKMAKTEKLAADAPQICAAFCHVAPENPFCITVASRQTAAQASLEAKTELAAAKARLEITIKETAAAYQAKVKAGDDFNAALAQAAAAAPGKSRTDLIAANPALQKLAQTQANAQTDEDQKSAAQNQADQSFQAVSAKDDAAADSLVRADVAIRQTDPADWCPDAADKSKAIVLAWRDERAEVPSLMASFAFAASQASFEYVSNDAAGALTTAKAQLPAFSMAMSFARMGSETPLSFEIPLRVKFEQLASSTTAKWCVPAGTVARADGSGSDPAETCTEKALGKPVGITTFDLGAFVGFFSRENRLARVAFGPIARFVLPEEGQMAYQIGGAIPIYLNANLLPDGKGVLKGIIRLTPRIVRTRDVKGVEDTRFDLTLDLLTGRSSFLTAGHQP